MKRLLLLILLTLKLNAYSQKTVPNPNKNPIIGMFFQRYLNLRSVPLTINYKIKTLLLKNDKSNHSMANKNGWVITFEDNFDSLDKNKWRLGQPWGYYHSESLHQYHDEKNLRIQNGNLILEGKYNPKEFKCNDSLVNIPYSIGLINSDISFSQKYGYFEIRSKNPAGAATWPAFWLTGAHKWPPEIDIFEMYGKRNGKRIHKQISSIHYGLNGSQSKGTLVRKIWLHKNTDSAFHTYACYWTPKFIKFYTDGILVRNQKVNKRLRQWMDDEMVIIINNGFEAKYLKYLPKDFKGNEFVVDWVRVFRKL